MIRKLLAVTVAAMAIASVQGVASADPAPQKELCKNGGYADYVDPTTDLPFKNQGRCVSFVNAGGTLVPVQEEPPSSDSLTFVFEENVNGPAGTISRVFGLAPGESVRLAYIYGVFFATRQNLGEYQASQQGDIGIMSSFFNSTDPCYPYFPLMLEVTRASGQVVTSQPYSRPPCPLNPVY